MQFFTIATLLFTAASGVMGAPAPAPSTAEPSRLQARTCGTLTGKPLEVCQGVCKAACNAIPPSLAKTACKKSCTLGPLKAREVEAAEEHDDNDDDAFAHIDFEVFASLGGDDDDDVNAKASADASALKAREPGISKHDVCHAACAVTCNSTVLALRQKWCLEKCNAKCPAE